MYNSKRYDTSDAAQPAYIVKNNTIVNPAYPADMQVIGNQYAPLPDAEFLMSLKRKLKYAKKVQDQRKIRAIETMLEEIQSYEPREY